MISKLLVGSRAPDFNFESPWDNQNSFYGITKNKSVIIIFLRYIGCPVCQYEMASIRRKIDNVNQKNIMLFVVLQSTTEMIRSVAEKDDWPFTIICDPEGKIFRQYSVEKGNLLKYLNPIGLIAAAKSLMAGYSHGKFEGDETQLPAAFSITGDKTIKYAHYGNRVNDIPGIEELTKAFD